MLMYMYVPGGIISFVDTVFAVSSDMSCRITLL